MDVRKKVEHPVFLTYVSSDSGRVPCPNCNRVHIPRIEANIFCGEQIDEVSSLNAVRSTN